MAFIDVVEWNPTSNGIFAYRFPNSNLSTFTQLIVHESQEAILFSKGRLMGKFGPGKHQLSTENLPVLRNLFGIPFGGKNPFVAEVWYVNKTAPLNIDWKTTTMRFMDPDYGQMVPLVAKGRYGLKVQDAERFLVQLVGTLPSFTARDLSDHFMGALISKTNSSIMSYMNVNRIGINQISSYLEELSTFIKQPMSEFWEQFGFELAGFYITEVNLDLSTPEGQKISEALSDRSAQAIAGYTWQQKQSFDVANNAASGGTQIGILAAGMMSGAFSGGNGYMGQPMMHPMGQPMMQQPINTQQYGMHVKAEVFCSNCGKKYSRNSQFCPFCGNQYHPCPTCGADNPANARRCVTCGTMLATNTFVGDVCSKCKTPVQPGAKFCSVCGNPIG